MTDNRTTELREKLDALGVEHYDTEHMTEWHDARGLKWNYFSNGENTDLTLETPWEGCTPEQAIAATLGNHPTKSGRGYYTDRDDEGTHIMCYSCGEYIGTAEEIAATLGTSNYIAKALIDDMLDFIGNCCETTLDFGCCDPVDCKYLDGDGELAECTRYQDFLSRAKAVAATLGGDGVARSNNGVTAEQVRKSIERHFGKVAVLDDGKPVEWRDDWICKVAIDYKGITDELNAKLGSGTCEFVVKDNMNESEGMGDVWIECSACHCQFDYYADDWLMKMSYCPNCSARNRKAVER